MVQIATLVGEVTRLKNELERVDALRKESETSLSRAVLLFENFISATGNNDRDALEKTAGSAREFLDRLKE